MKIAILSPKKSSQAETFIQNHIKNLPFEKIVVYSGDFPYLTEALKPSVVKSSWFKLVSKIKRLFGIETQIFRAYHLTKILEKHKVDLVFAEYLTTGAEVLEVCKSLRIPLMTIALGYEISQYDILQRYKDKYRELFKYAQTVFIVSNHMKVNLKSFDCPGHKIVYSPIGPADDFFKINPKFKNKQLLAIGRFVDKKAPHLTIKAFFEVLKKHPDAILKMAGDGPLLDHCMDLVKKLNIEGHVTFIGRIDQEEQKRLLEASYMFVQHSRIAKNGDSEGTPVAILEASAAGLPIVSTRHAGIPNIVKDSETGFLVEENDVEAMALKMIELLQEKELAIQFGSKGKEYIKANFTLERHIKTISNCILD